MLEEITKLNTTCAERVEDCNDPTIGDSSYCANHSKCYTFALGSTARCQYPRHVNANGEVSKFCLYHNEIGAEQYASYLYKIKQLQDCRRSTDNQCYPHSKNCVHIHQWLVKCQHLTQLVYERLYHPEIQGNNHGQYLIKYERLLKACDKFCPLDSKTNALIKETKREWSIRKSDIRRQCQRGSRRSSNRKSGNKSKSKKK